MVIEMALLERVEGVVAYLVQCTLEYCKLEMNRSSELQVCLYVCTVCIVYSIGMQSTVRIYCTVYSIKTFR
jgi:hypothetical protein